MKISNDNKSDFYIYGVHLKSGTDPTDEKLREQFVIKLLDKIKGNNFIIVGDINEDFIHKNKDKQYNKVRLQIQQNINDVDFWKNVETHMKDN